MKRAFETLLDEVRTCDICRDVLEPRPVLQVSEVSRVLIVGQAPGSKVHETGIPFDDASGERLRAWMGIDRDTFYDARQVAILPMGFCYPGRGKSGDLPPDSRCAGTWRARILERLQTVELTLVIGQYAMEWHLEKPGSKTLTDVVRDWRSFGEAVIPLPHPSPRNNIWLKKNPWFEKELVPELKSRVRQLLT